MLKGFEGYYKPDFKKLWGEATFVIDANVLLNLYRSSPQSRAEMLGVLESLADRLWIPHQFMAEYHRHFAKISADIESNYTCLESVLTKRKDDTTDLLCKKFADLKKRTGLELDPRSERIAEIFDLILKDVTAAKDEHLASLNNEPVQDRIALLFRGRYGDPCDDSKVEEVREKAKERLEKGIPPGSAKDSSKEFSDPHGDYIGWRQILEYAKNEKKSVILVTNDEDWYFSYKGKVKGPHPLLVQEMYNEAEAPCYIYKSWQFIKFAKEYLDAQVSEETIEEALVRERVDAADARESLRVIRDRELLDREFGEVERRGERLEWDYQNEGLQTYNYVEGDHQREDDLRRQRAREKHLEQRRRREAFLERQREREEYLEQRRQREEYLEQRRQREEYLEQRRQQAEFLEQRRQQAEFLEQRRQQAEFLEQRRQREESLQDRRAQIEGRQTVSRANSELREGEFRNK